MGEEQFAHGSPICQFYEIVVQQQQLLKWREQWGWDAGRQAHGWFGKLAWLSCHWHMWLHAQTSRMNYECIGGKVKQWEIVLTGRGNEVNRLIVKLTECSFVAASMNEGMKWNAKRGEERRGEYQERRKGSSKLLKTLIMRLSLVTEWISGPGNCPLISIPCQLQFAICNATNHKQIQHPNIVWGSKHIYIYMEYNIPFGERRGDRCLRKSHSKWRTCRDPRRQQWPGRPERGKRATLSAPPFPSIQFPNLVAYTIYLCLYYYLCSTYK